MEGRNRTIFVVLIAIVIVVAVFSSFGLNLFAPAAPEITLPAVYPGGSDAGDGAECDPNHGPPPAGELFPDHHGGDLTGEWDHGNHGQSGLAGCRVDPGGICLAQWNR